jgi:hypothetical protein
LNSRTFMAGATISYVSSPDARTGAGNLLHEELFV